jgi:hypothetical protein
MPDDSDPLPVEFTRTQLFSTLPRGGPRTTLRVAVIGAISLAVAVGLTLPNTACSTRSTTATLGPDSTLVYASSIPGDVQVSITFALKDSKIREEQRRLERERQRQIQRERREREAKERAARAKEKSRKASKSKKTKKAGKQKDQSAAASRPASPDTTRVASAESVATAGSAATDQISSKKSPSLPPDERVFELEEGARVQAYVRFENPYGRGNRPLLIHAVWLNPEGKRVFKKMIEWTPNDSSQVVTTSLTISPAKRTTGTYTLHVYLFRELMAEKSIQLAGTSTALQEKDDKSGM